MAGRLRGSRRGIGKIGVLVILALGILAVLLFLPLPWIGLPYYNVEVQSTLSETCVIYCSYSVQSVNPSVIGAATAIDLSALFPGIWSVTPPCVACQYKVVSSLSNGQSGSGSETKFVSNLFNYDYTDTVTFLISYVPAGSYTVSTQIYLNGQAVGSPGTASLTVG
jgi:hypothetical protein